MPTASPGEAGFNYLFGGAGADTIDGGEGYDLTFYTYSDAGVTVNLATGAGQGGHAEGDTLTGIEEVWGSRHADHLIGSSGNDALVPLIFDFFKKSLVISGATVDLNGALSEPLHLREDLVGCFRPLERLALVIVGVHVGGDGVAQRVRADLFLPCRPIHHTRHTY